jgi:predicted phage terminase large subunit-like protein
MQTLLAMDLKSFSKTLSEKRARLTRAEFKALIRLRAFYDFEFFVRYFFPHLCRLPFSAMHDDFCQAERDPYRRGRREVIAAPRNHAKTTFKTLLKVMHAIVYGYEFYILILSYSKEEARQKVQNILHQLTTNQRLIQVYGRLAPIRGQQHPIARWGTQRFTTQNGIHVQAKSRLASVRGLNEDGHRPSLIIGDDLESPERIYNPEQRQKTLDWFTKDILKLGQADNSTNIIVVGTLLHPDSLLSHLLKRPGWTTRRYQALLHPAENQDLWNEYKQLYTNLSDPHRVETAHAFYEVHEAAMLAGASVLWPESDSYEKLICMQMDEGMASFQSEKQNEPYDPERQVLNMHQAKYFQFVYDGQGRRIALQWLSGAQKTVSLSDLEIVAFHDPALGETHKSDYAALVVVGRDAEGYFYGLDVYLEKVFISRQLEQVLHLEKAWGLKRLYLEAVGFQGVLKEDYRRLKQEHPHCKVEVIPVSQHHNKQWRISTLEPLITNGYLLFAETLPPHFIEQLVQFPTHHHDDGPDALQGAIAQLQKRVEPVIGAPFQVATGPHPNRLF